MKKPIIALLMAALFAFSAAHAEITIVTVSMQKLFDGYYKSAEANGRLESLQQEAQSEAQAKEAELQTMVEAIQTMQQDMENPALSDSAKEEMMAEIQQKAAEGRQKQAEFQQWQQQTSGRLQARGQEIRNTLIEEIAGVVKEIALKDHGADLVFDTSDILGSGVPTVLHASSDLDITNKVLVELNRDAPDN